GRSALLMATDARQADAVFWLLEQGANPNLSDRVGDRPLHLAAQRGDANILAALIRAGAELDAVDAGGNSALMLALKAEHLKPVTQLLDAGADPNITNQRHENPLSQARHREMKEAETLLLSRGARMPQKAQPQLAMKTALEQSEQSLFKGWPALSVAAWLGQSERVERLLKQGANPNETGPGGHTALTRAAWRGQPDIVQQLLTAGARIDQTDDSGRTPLSWALSSEVNISSATNADETGDQTLATVSRLLAASSTAAVNLLDNSGHTPLWYAVTSQLPERLQQALVARLLKAGAEPDLQGADATPVLIAAVNALLDSTAHKQGLVIKQLLASGSDVNQTDNKGRDALWYAANQGRTDVLEILIAAGAQGQSADEQGHRAIERCVVSRSPECLQGLLSVSHDKAEFQKHTTKQGNSLLLLAASLPEDDALAMFEQLNSASSLQLDQKNNDGDTALMQAAAHGNERLVARLMKAGADPWLRNHSKQSAADLARMAGHEALAANLEQSGDKSGYWWKLLTGSDGR
ncbi:MAG: ankyrin repeat domain-containing protein, partial [Oceanobacter sp.]